MERRRRENLKKEFQQVEKGWYLGDEQLRQKLLTKVSVKAGPDHFGAMVQEAAEAQAQPFVEKALKRMKLREADLSQRRSGDAGKVRLASEVRAGTTAPPAWIAERLKMGSRGYLAFLLNRYDKAHKSQNDGVSYSTPGTTCVRTLARFLAASWV
jgi:hypothetical protein